MRMQAGKLSIAVALVAGSLALNFSAGNNSRIWAQDTGSAPQAASPAVQTNPARIGGGGRGGAVDPKLYAPMPLESPSTVKNFPPAPTNAQPGSRGGPASYPRVIQIKHYAPLKGQLMATFDQGGRFPIYLSKDNGDSWEFLTSLAELRQQPALFELPRRMGDLPAGTILAAGMATTNDAGKSAVSAYYSTDGAKTWQFLSKIIEGTPSGYDPGQRSFVTKNTPVWEPYLYTDSRGRLVAYYSDERYKKDGYNQLLAHRVSNDGGRTWGREVFDVAIADGLVRAGMSVVTQNTNTGKYFMTYELVGLPGYPIEPRSNPVHFRTSNDGNNFGDPKDRGVLIQDRWRQFLWATPYIVWSPWPAPNGTLIATARASMRFLDGQVGNGMMINRNNGEGLWTLIETPIRYTPPDGYSQTMIPLGDGREILQMLGADGQMKYAKFKLPEKLPEYEFPFGPKKP
ncbi:MAG: sialidase family protein [Steroidobacteraceae bacterium]